MTNREPRFNEREQMQADAWNALHPVGTHVLYRSAPGMRPLRTTTRSEAWVLSGHTAVVQVSGVSGCVALDAVEDARWNP